MAAVMVVAEFAGQFRGEPLSSKCRYLRNWAMVADVALPTIFARLKDLRLDESAGPVRFGGWAFRGPLNMPVRWSA